MVKTSKTFNISPWRFYLVLAVLLTTAFVMAWRIIDLQLSNQDFQIRQGDARTLRTAKIPAHRGMILDRQGEPLAVSTPVVSIWANPQELLEQPKDWPKLAKVLGIKASNLSKRIKANADKEFIYLKRQLAPQQGKQVLALAIPGVYQQKEYRRYYPAGEVTAQLVGFTNIDDRGQEGLELAYDQWLTGIPGKKRVLKDRLGRVIKDIQALSSPSPGKDLKLSIDLGIQYLAYRELKAAVQYHGADSGSVVVLDSQSGEVLAMVNQPSFNPNNRKQLQPASLRNRALIDMFEPGSTMKPFGMAAALTSGQYSPTDVINTSPGYFPIGRYTIHDHRNYGAIDLNTIMQKSSNVGMAKIALSLDPEAVWQLYQALGFGTVTASQFPGESAGLLPHPPRWNNALRATLTYGYGISTSALQLAQAYSVLANSGIKRPVSLLKLEQTEPGQRVMSAKVAQQIMTMLQGVVSPGGGGTRAQVTGYQVAGKTGTARLLAADGYQKKAHRSIFAGIAPVTNPRIVVVVVINNPRKHHYFGGLVAAPVFSSIAAGALRLLNATPDKLTDLNIAAAQASKDRG
jgi:cell division protein FtsI (penicillin-binding protein 3)